MKKGKLFVLSAPSGGGKSTIVRRLLKEMENMEYSISVTTRPKRKGEINGKDYYFVSEREFKKMIENNEFLEYAVVHNHYYGTKKSIIEEKLKAGKSILLDIDVQGAINIKKLMPDAVLIFIDIPSLKELEKRLRNRGTDSEEVIKLRLENAKKELEYKNKYDYVVMNDNLEKCINEIKAIIKKELKE